METFSSSNSTSSTSDSVASSLLGEDDAGEHQEQMKILLAHDDQERGVWIRPQDQQSDDTKTYHHNNRFCGVNVSWILFGFCCFLLGGSCLPVFGRRVTATNNKEPTDTTSMLPKVECKEELPTASTESQTTSLDVLTQASMKTNMTLPLRPPFRIMQVGQPRSGSTFQFHLLDAITQLKNDPDQYEIDFKFQGNIDEDIAESFAESFVYKTHKRKSDVLWRLHEEGELVIFTSGVPTGLRTGRLSLYNQEKANLITCAECEVDNYAALFDLSPEEVNLVKNYLRLYSLLRRCCGLQMSKYEAARLSGCNVTQYTTLPEYPYCELVNKSAVEEQMMHSPIQHRSDNPSGNWAVPGDCAKFDAKLMSGKGHCF
jgi:hypothetical protein